MKLSKVFSIITIAVMLVATMSNIVLATTIGGVDINPSAGTADDKIVSIGNKIIGTVQTVGTIVAVLVLVVLGIKYMMGSAEEKADYKKSMIPYLVGAVLIFASTTIVNIVYQLANSLN